jgi:hypothetical protein
MIQFESAEDELLFPGSEQPAFTRLLDLNLELFGGVSDAVAGGRHDSEGFHDQAGRSV